MKVMFFEVWVRLSCWLWNVAHNAIVHPLMPFLPESLTSRAHDWTAAKWNYALQRKRYGSDPYFTDF